jgi:hypothetical protein
LKAHGRAWGVDHGSGSDEMRDLRLCMDELLYHEEMMWL